MNNKFLQQPNEPLSTKPVTGESLADDNKAADQSRRRFVKRNLLGLALAPMATFYVSENAWAQARGTRPEENEAESLPPAELSPDDPEAKTLSYTTQSMKEGQSCANCQLYTGSEGEEWGPCAIFSYRYSTYGKRLLVSAKGWCRGWAPRQPL